MYMTTRTNAYDLLLCSTVLAIFFGRVVLRRTCTMRRSLVRVFKLLGGLVERVVDDALEVRERGLEATMCATKEKEDGRRMGSNTG